MLRDVISVEALPEHRLRVAFDDGTEGVVNVADMVEFTGVFEPLRAPSFSQRLASMRNWERFAGRTMPTSTPTCCTPRSLAFQFRSTPPRDDEPDGSRFPTSSVVLPPGDTRDEVEREMKGAIAFHLDGLKAEGMAIPQPSNSSSYVEIPA